MEHIKELIKYIKNIMRLEEHDECPSCKIGLMKVRQGKYGEFLGCDKFPDCAYSCKTDKEYNPDDELPRDKAVDSYF